MATSTKQNRRSSVQLAADGFAALVEKLGMAEAVRYTQLYHQGAGDYTSERHEWLGQIGQDQVASLIAATRKKSPRKHGRPTAQEARGAKELR